MIVMAQEKKPIDIPIEIINLIAEALSPHNDGWTQKGARDRLIAIRDFIDKALGGKK